MMTANVDQVPI